MILRKTASSSRRIIITPYFDATLPGGGSLYSIDLARIWLQKGYELHILCSDYKRDIQDLSTFLLTDQLIIHPISDQSKIMRAHFVDREVYSHAEKIIEELKPESIHVHNFHGLLGAVRAAVDSPYKTVYTALDFGLICLNWYLYDGTNEPCTGPVPEKCKRCLYENNKTPLKITLASYLPSLFIKLIGKDPVYFKQYRHLNSYFNNAEHHLKEMLPLLEKFDAIITISPKTAEILSSYDRSGKRIHCYTQGLNFSDLKIEERRNDNYVKLVYLGHLAPAKGFQVILKAVEMLPDGLNLRINIYGDYVKKYMETQHESIKRYVKGYSLLVDQEVENELVNSDALVIPSLWYENTPYSVLRALAVSRPVIASNHLGISHLINHGVNGFLIPPGDVQAWKSILLDVCERPDILRKMRENCIYRKTVCQYVEEIENVISNI